MDKKLRVVVADDHPYEVSGIVDLLVFADEIEVVGKAQTAQQAVLQVFDKNPDVILLDMIWYKNKEEGLTAIRQIREGSATTRILVMTAYDEMLEPASNAGADRVIHKDYLNSKDALVSHIQAAYEARLLPSTTNDESLFGKLSKRERQVLECLCEGLPDKMIAERLGISTKTVKKYDVQIYNKLGVNSRTEAVALAIQKGLLARKKGPED
jgi:DNA-binding NarL/FixJ family response regulator